MYPVERIRTIDRNASINGAVGIEVCLHGMIDSWQYTGDFANHAYDLLEGVEANPIPPNFPAIQVLVNGQPSTFSSVTLSDGTVLDGVIQVADQQINVNDILWIDLASNLNGQTGVEVRVVTDEPGITRQFTGQAASDAYDALVALVPENAAAAGN
jgi:hypothetical protein